MADKDQERQLLDHQPKSSATPQPSPAKGRSGRAVQPVAQGESSRTSQPGGQQKGQTNRHGGMRHRQNWGQQAFGARLADAALHPRANSQRQQQRQNGGPDPGEQRQAQACLDPGVAARLRNGCKDGVSAPMAGSKPKLARRVMPSPARIGSSTPTSSTASTIDAAGGPDGSFGVTLGPFFGQPGHPACVRFQ